MDASVILTVVGSDRPGLTSALADAVLSVGGNWMESHLSRLGGKYVGSVLVGLPASKVEALAEACRAVDRVGLTVTIIEAGDEVPAATPLSLELVGQDRPGIVREIAAAMAALGVNIAQMETGVVSESWSGAPLFEAHLELELPAATTADAVREALEAISGEIMVDFNLIRPLPAR